ncbi:MAG: ABC transporter permease subunit [Micrococcales bacterium]|nr:ABC transporter permease subunit [Micrococcales bacterium]MCL2668524.1 ABC transporter permease subunit [Micrococcales bacterium]
MSIDNSVSFPPSGVSASRLWQLFSDPRWRESIVLSVGVASSSGLLATSMASALVLLVRRLHFGTGAIATIAVSATAVTPAVFLALGFVFIENEFRWNSVMLLCWAHAVVCLPYAYLIMRLSAQTLQDGTLDSARLLGAGRVRTLFQITLPHFAPFAALSVLLSFIVSMSEPIIASFLLNDGRTTVAQRSFQGLRFSLDVSILTAGSWIVIFTGAAVVLAVSVFSRLRRYLPEFLLYDG